MKNPLLQGTVMPWQGFARKACEINKKSRCEAKIGVKDTSSYV
ncbi:MAG: hypothetical protein ACFCUM_04515 [Bacteroidales bacterium]